MSGEVERDYVLGTHDAEVARLGVQHRVWRSRVLDAWHRAGLTIGQTVVDLGCGPGYATLDLAEIVGPSGRVLGLDRSARFLGVLAGEVSRRGLTAIATHERDLDEGDWPAAEADLVWCRWVAAFVRDPRAFVARACGLVRPGGRIVMHEYLDYATWRLMPASPIFETFVADVMTTWRAAGGEPDIGRALPGWLEAEGLEIERTIAHVDVVTPRDHIWQWPRQFVEVGLERLVAIGAIGAEHASVAWQDFLAREAGPHARMATPTVLEVIAVRRH